MVQFVVGKVHCFVGEGTVASKEIMERQKTLLPPEIAQEKIKLLAKWLGNRSLSQFFQLIK